MRHYGTSQISRPPFGGTDGRAAEKRNRDWLVGWSVGLRGALIVVARVSIMTMSGWEPGEGVGGLCNQAGRGTVVSRGTSDYATYLPPPALQGQPRRGLDGRGGDDAGANDICPRPARGVD